jgi:hypothetical protein
MPKSYFYPRKGSSDGLHSWCKLCFRWYKYNITWQEGEALYAKQSGMCALCDKPLDGKFHVDHDHRCCPGDRSCGKCVRGLLCGICNCYVVRYFEDAALRVRVESYIDGLVIS